MYVRTARDWRMMERQKNDLEASETFVQHFGELSQQAALNSIEAYTSGGPSVDIARAWLLQDGEGLNRLTWSEIVGEEEAAKILNAALFSAAQELWSSRDMSAKYRPPLRSVPDTA